MTQLPLLQDLVGAALDTEEAQRPIRRAVRAELGEQEARMERLFKQWVRDVLDEREDELLPRQQAARLLGRSVRDFERLVEDARRPGGDARLLPLQRGAAGAQLWSRRALLEWKRK